MVNEFRIDALLPAEMAQQAEYLGVRKAEAPFAKTLVRAVLAGASIALGAVFATTVATGTSGRLPYGVAKALIGLVFCLGLVLVIVGGAELFTGNNLTVMAWANGKIRGVASLRNWAIVYLGNLIGSLGTAILVVASRQYSFAAGGIGAMALSIAAGKLNLAFVQATALGIICNALVCLAIWMSFSARSTVDKIAVILFPISAFVAAGFEYSVANMHFVPVALLIRKFAPLFAAKSGIDLSAMTWGHFLLNNLLPVTIGNIIGGAVLVAVVYWFVFLRQTENS
jgi:formate transporter